MLQVCEFETTTPTKATTQPSLNKSSTKVIKKRSRDQQNLEFIDFCKKQLEKSNDGVEEYEAVAISWGKKLKRMDAVQAIHAE